MTVVEMAADWGRNAEGPTGLIELLRRHGAWAPGARVFRRLRFRAQALTISTAFLVPLVALFYLLWQQSAALKEQAAGPACEVARFKPPADQ